MRELLETHGTISSFYIVVIETYIVKVSLDMDWIASCR